MLGVLNLCVSLAVLLLLAYWSVGTKKRIRQLDQTLEALSAHVWNASLLVRGLPATSFPPPPTGWAASSDVLVALVRESRANHPVRVVELGSGVSTLVMANELARVGQGTLVSIDHDDVFASRTRDMIDAAGLPDLAEVRVASLAVQEIGGSDGLWYDKTLLEDLEQVSLLFVDGPPGMLSPGIRRSALDFFWPRMARHGRIVFDDAYRTDEKAFIDRWESSHPDCVVEWLDPGRRYAVLQKIS